MTKKQKNIIVGASKQRDPFVLLLVTKKRGAHGKSFKAVRASEKVKFRREALSC